MSVTGAVIGACIEVHRQLGPGLLESAYEECLAHELSLRRMVFRRQVQIPVRYKGLRLDCAYRMDFVVEEKVVLELKAVAALLPIHEAQLLTYMRLTHRPFGLLINFHTYRLSQGGIRRFTLRKSTNPP
jgi:GxxExxY protein